MDFPGQKANLYGPMTKKAMTDKAMSEHHPIFDDYDRYVISPERAKQSGMFSREFTVEMEDGSTRTFKNVVDAQQYNQAAIHTGAVKINPKSLSSLTKEAA